MKGVDSRENHLVYDSCPRPVPNRPYQLSHEWGRELGGGKGDGAGSRVCVEYLFRNRD